MAKKYKDMTYTIRKSDNRLMKKVTVNGKTKYIYSTDVKDLYKQYIEFMHNSYNGLLDIKNAKNYWFFLYGLDQRTENNYP